MGSNAEEQRESGIDAQRHASGSNKQRQAMSRLNITHPVRWSDPELEDSYNIKRRNTKDRKSDLKRLHESDD